MAKVKQESQGLIQIPANIMVMIIRFYQLAISPWIGTHCRFSPTCSQYSLEAYQRFGLFKGSYLTVKRLGKCHPWHKGGLDELPKERKNK